VPIEEVAHWQYKIILIIFPLNLQTITITLDVVKLRGGVESLLTLKFQNLQSDGTGKYHTRNITVKTQKSDV